MLFYQQREGRLIKVDGKTFITASSLDFTGAFAVNTALRHKGCTKIRLGETEVLMNALAALCRWKIWQFY